MYDRPPVDYRQLAEISDSEQRERTRREWGLVGLDEDRQPTDTLSAGDGRQSIINWAIVESAPTYCLTTGNVFRVPERTACALGGPPQRLSSG
jgi:hypothetical protein